MPRIEKFLFTQPKNTYYDFLNIFLQCQMTQLLTETINETNLLCTNIFFF